MSSAPIEPLSAVIPPLSEAPSANKLPLKFIPNFFPTVIPQSDKVTPATVASLPLGVNHI